MRRQRIERGIYLSQRAGGRWVYEISWYDELGKQRWMTVGDSLGEARKLRAQYALNAVGGASKYKALRKDLFDIAKRSDVVTPDRRSFREAMAATTGDRPREAWIQLAALALARARQFDRLDA